MQAKLALIEEENKLFVCDLVCVFRKWLSFYEVLLPHKAE